MLQPLLIATLCKDSAVAKAVGDRVYLAGAPETAKRPYILLTGTGGAELVSQGKLSDLKCDTVEIAAVADTQRAAAELERAIEAVIVAMQSPVALATPQGRPYDAPSLDAKQTIFAVVRLWRIDHRA